jgi:hypothetical protein
VALPQVHLGVREQRAVLHRVVEFLVGEAGLRQLVDIGSGLPTAQNVHQVARGVAPDTHVAYVDNDQVVLAHARALLAGDKDTIVVDGDILRPAELLADAGLRDLIDFEQPVGLLLCGILHYVLDDEDPHGIMRVLVDALPSGSYVFVHHLVTAGPGADSGTAAAEAALHKGVGRAKFRTPDEVAAFLGGLELVEPGVVVVPDWRPQADTPSAEENPVLRLAVVGVGRKG